MLNLNWIDSTLRSAGFTFIILWTLDISAFAQTVLPKYYCQGCCGGVGVYYLKLDESSKFEVYYLTEYKTKDNSYFGFGKYSIKNDFLTLTFENIPLDGIELRKINVSDSLIIHFLILDNIRKDSVPLVNVQFGTGKTFFFANSSGTIKTKFGRAQIINFSSIGFKDISYSLKEPGEYEMKVKLNPEATIYHNQGLIKEFKIVKTKTQEWFEDVADKKLKFTTKSCKN